MLHRCTTRALHSFRSLAGDARAMSEKPPFRKPRYDGRSKKRRWEERRSDRAEAPDAKRERAEDRRRKRKYALLLGYSGSEYFGMQRNATMKTIEEELFRAFLASDYITEEGFGHPQSVQFQRAARTDKGVSAARQVVSIKLFEGVDISKINDHLPEVIRIFDCKRVTKGFNSKQQCNARTYFYMLPTVAFSDGAPPAAGDFRLSAASLGRVNEILGGFVGTKNYHNFTSKRLPNDPSCNRYIMSFECEPPIVRRGAEFAVLKVKGQSFILHQIRKMVGLTIAVLRGHATDGTFAKAFSPEKVNIPRAPGLGLVLDFVHYDRYNARYGGDGIHETLEWTELEATVGDFKERHIYPTIVDTEVDEGSMVTWLEKVSGHSFDVLDGDEQPEEESNGESEEDASEGKAGGAGEIGNDEDGSRGDVPQKGERIVDKEDKLENVENTESNVDATSKEAQVKCQV